jgi:CRISPR-associated protein (TIGR03986 family)
MKIFVGNLSYKTKQDRLKREFEKLGNVEKVDIVIDRDTGQSKGFAFVIMPDDNEAEKAIKELDGRDVDGRNIKVEQARQGGQHKEGRNIKGQERVKRQPRRDNVNTSGADEGYFINPYNFMPVQAVKEELLCSYLNEGAHFQDRFREGTHSGRIVCEIKTESEIFIGAGTEEERDCDAKKPAKLKSYMLNGEPAIPPSTLKGMLSSIMEAASNSALRVLDKRYYTRREKLKNKHIGMIVADGDHIKYILPLKKGIPVKKDNAPKYKDFNYPVYIDGYFNGLERGLLQKRNENDFSASKKCYYIDTRVLEYKINIKDWFLGYKIKKNASDPFITAEEYENKSINDKKHYRKGLFKILGIGESRKDNIPRNKKHELFLFLPEDTENAKLLTISQDAVKKFNILSDDRSSHNTDDMSLEKLLPYSPKGRIRGKDLKLRVGDVVYYEDDIQGVKNISFSACWRDFCGGVKEYNDAFGYFKLVDRNGYLLPPSMVNQGIDDPWQLKLTLTPVCSLLGFVEEGTRDSSEPGKALAGRLFFSPGMLSPDKDNKSEVLGSEKTLKILDSPKPPCPEFYFKRRNNSGTFITKEELKPEDNYLPKGRKFYLHHNSYSSNPDAPDDNYIKEHCKQLSTIKPINKNNKFLFSIDFFNLTDFELGMLLYVLKPTKEFRHLIGMGKPLGLGKINIEILNVLFVNRHYRYREEPLFTDSFFHCQSDTKQERLSKIEGCFSGKENSFYKNRFCHTVSETYEKDKDYFINKFKSAINRLYDENWLIQLENIGNPESTNIPDVPVQYPNLKKGGVEECFKWWVRNSGKERHVTGAKVTLKEVPENAGDKMPTLPFNPVR